MGALPAIMNTAYLQVFFGGSIFDHIPLDGDALTYWTQLRSMKLVGFNFGYYGYEQTTARHLSFGFHGLWYPLFLYALSMFQTWQFYSIPLFLTGFLCFSVCLYVLLVNPGWKQCLAIAFFLATFFPIVFSTTQSLQDCAHYGFSIILAGLFIRYIQCVRDGRALVKIKTALLLFIAFISLCRVSWAIAAIPLMLIDIFTERGFTRRVGIAACYIAAMAAVYHFSYSFFNAPNPYNDDVGALLDFLLLKDFGWLTRLHRNITNLLAAPVSSYHYSSFAFRYQCLVVFTFCMASFFVNRDVFCNKGEYYTYFVVMFMMSVGAIAMLCVVHVTHFVLMFRHLSLYVIFTFFFCILKMPPRWVAAMLVLGSLALPFQMSMYNWYVDLSMDPLGYKRAAAVEDGEYLKKYISYAVNAKSKWCNTIIALNYDIAPSLPPGIGINTIRDIGAIDKVYSRYVYLPFGSFSSEVSRLGLIEVGRTRDGGVYMNPAVQCGP